MNNNELIIENISVLRGVNFFCGNSLSFVRLFFVSKVLSIYLLKDIAAFRAKNMQSIMINSLLRDSSFKLEQPNIYPIIAKGRANIV